MQPRKKAVFSLLAALACANLVLRFPSSSHEMGIDSFVWHGMATSLVSHNYALWILSPLSYLGLYPLSQPSGTPFLTAAVSLVYGGPLEGSILAVDMVTAIVGMLGAFCLGREFSRKGSLPLLFAAVFSLSPIMVSGLTWQVPTRLMFTTLLPFVLWTLIRLYRAPDWRYISFLATELLLMASFHRLAVFVALVVVAYLFTRLALVILRTLRIKNPGLFLRPRFVRITPLLAVVALLGISGATLATTHVLDEYSEGVIASDSSLSAELVNLAVSLARSSGLLLPMGFVGLFGVAMRRNRDVREPFVIVALFTFAPLLFIRNYTGYYTVPFTSLFIAYGVLSASAHFRKAVWRRIAIGAAVALLISSSAVISEYNLVATTSMADSTYTLGLFIKDTSHGTVIANDGLTGARIHAISGVPYLPVGGATTAFQSPELLMFRFLDAANVSNMIFLVPFSQLTLESDSTYVLVNVQAEADWAQIQLSSVDAIPARYDIYNVGYAIELRSLVSEYTAYGNVYPSLLLSSASSSRYIVYQDSTVNVFLLR